MLDFICFSVNNWEKRKARKQQFMQHFSLREDVGRVLYIEPPLNFFRLLILPFSELKTIENRRRWARGLKARIEPLSGKLFLFTPVFYFPFFFRSNFIYNLNLFFSLFSIKRRLKKIGFKNIILWLYHPLDYRLLRWFKERVISVFDWAEDWAEYFTEFSRKKSRSISQLEEKMIQEADLVFVVSERLFERAKILNHQTYQISDGTVPEIFAEYDGRVPIDMAGIPHPILGYAGSVFRRIDLDLIMALSKRLPDYSIVLVGNILSPPAQLIKIKQKNIFLLGGKDYAELPNYMMNFDVCILPYIPILHTSCPTKIYDYFATGKPVVSTYLPELKNFSKLIKLAHTQEEFISSVSEALNASTDAASQRRRGMAQENSWLIRTDEIMEIIRKKSKL